MGARWERIHFCQQRPASTNFSGVGVIIESISIRNFRAIEQLDLALDRLTILLGANSVGKSSVVRALEWFFSSDSLELEDVRDRDPARVVSVRVTFAELTDADRRAFPSYTTGEQMTLLKVRNADGSIKLTGRGLVYPPFEAIRQIGDAVPLRQAFNAYVDDNPGLSLTRAASKPAALSEMAEWEHAHPEECAEADQDATHLLGAVGQGVLRQRFEFVLVPALRDAALEAREGRDTTLGRLLGVIAERRATAGEQIAELEEEMRARYERVVTEAHGESLDELSSAMTDELRVLISEGEVHIEAEPASLSLPNPRVLLRAGEGGSVTDIGRQGHGFQRTFIITALRYLSEQTAVEGDVPSIFLALEEPELYQHPVRSRHFASVLERLTLDDDSRVQVLYATHSPYFVNAQRFASIRLFRRGLDSDGRLLPPRVASASAADVALRLAGIVDGDQIQRRMTRTIDYNALFSEAFFANGVILCEGLPDSMVLREVARRSVPSLEAEGIVAVQASKTALPVAYVILDLLEIPTYVIFDGDKDCREDNREQTKQHNRNIQSAMRLAIIEDFPSSGARGSWAVFEDSLESCLKDAIDDFDAKCQRASGRSDWRPKSGETYVEVLSGETAVPALLSEIVTCARALSRS
jgi:putative ATP-dependent endonuclease of OLD family